MEEEGLNKAIQKGMAAHAFGSQTPDFGGSDGSLELAFSRE